MPTLYYVHGLIKGQTLGGTMWSSNDIHVSNPGKRGGGGGGSVS